MYVCKQYFAILLLVYSYVYWASVHIEGVYDNSCVYVCMSIYKYVCTVCMYE